ncbi:hypothetical protein DFP72DRAFT_906203 [Ephemerocybe angulata]|uniref:Uncharacterized protein n=1 Tax=Ephemerocybe angulata TaxID=980116 RepID=A0A8H6M1M1_9AGAR|nr:hypothetical protein DFP72DRAFT_906203 [Tulosesus angulatus]
MSTLNHLRRDKATGSYKLPNVPPEIYDDYVMETIGIVLGLILYGIAFSLFTSCLRSLFKSLKQNGTVGRSRPKLLHLVYVCLIFAVGTMYSFSGIWILVYLRLEYPMYPGGPLGWEFVHYNWPIMTLGNVGFTLTAWLSDGFMLYRCFVVYNEESRIRTVLILPGLLYLASLSSS